MVKKIVLLLILMQQIPLLQAQPKGLPNCGASCYLNSVTQCLYNIDELTQLFIKSPLEKPARSFLAAQKFPYAYQELVKQLYKTPKTLQPNDATLQAYQEVAFDMMTVLTGQGANQQEDAQEFLYAAFNALKNTNETINTVISNDLFGFFKTVKTTFPILDEPPIITFKNGEPEYFLSLPIKTSGNEKKKIPSINLSTLAECLDEYFKEELFDDPDNYLAYTGDEFPLYTNAQIPNAKKRTELVNLPNLLILSLNRFTIDNFGQRRKLTHTVTIPDQLTMSKFVKEIFSSENYDYELVSVVVHTGGAESGHYIAYVKNNNQWYLCNDASIRTTTFSSMNNPSNPYAIQTGAYVLFYKKKELIEPSLSLISQAPEVNLNQALTNLRNTLNLLEIHLQKK